MIMIMVHCKNTKDWKMLDEKLQDVKSPKSVKNAIRYNKWCHKRWSYACACCLACVGFNESQRQLTRVALGCGSVVLSTVGMLVGVVRVAASIELDGRHNPEELPLRI